MNDSKSDFELTIGQMATMACILEATAPKPGNVHRGADFADTSLIDFMASAVAVGPVMERFESDRVGQLILDSVVATQAVTSSNTNLGLILLLAPLVKSCRNRKVNDRVAQERLASALELLDEQDARDIFQAIRLANPGGLGSVSKHDVNDDSAENSTTVNILDAMRLASSYDSIALQYVTNFATIFDLALPCLSRELGRQESLTDAIVVTHLFLMAEIPDTLIARKLGADVANESSARAKRVMEAQKISDQDYLRQLSEFDFWLRADGNRRNPGTTADLIGATIFVGLANGIVRSPYR